MITPERATALEDSLVELGFNPEKFNFRFRGKNFFVTGWNYQNMIIVDVIYQFNGILVCYDRAAKPIIDNDVS